MGSSLPVSSLHFNRFTTFPIAVYKQNFWTSWLISIENSFVSAGHPNNISCFISPSLVAFSHLLTDMRLSKQASLNKLRWPWSEISPVKLCQSLSRSTSFVGVYAEKRLDTSDNYKRRCEKAISCDIVSSNKNICQAQGGDKTSILKLVFWV